MELDTEFPPLPKTMEEPMEWRYTMRRDMQQIIPGVYLGPYSCAMKNKRSALEMVGITHIVCVRQDVEAHFIRPNFPDDFKYLVIDLADSVTANLIHHLSKVKEFIDECLKNNGAVLVHGNAGISRSAALVIGFIMETYGQTYKSACSIVQKKRFCINLNRGFVGQLQEYEPIYKARLLSKNGVKSRTRGKLKRTIEDLEGDMTRMGLCQDN